MPYVWVPDSVGHSLGSVSYHRLRSGKVGPGVEGHDNRYILRQVDHARGLSGKLRQKDCAHKHEEDLKEQGSHPTPPQREQASLQVLSCVTDPGVPVLKNRSAQYVARQFQIQKAK